MAHSKFDGAYCERVVEVMGHGLSLTAFAGEVGVSRATVNAWRAAYPEFAEAVQVGRARRTRFLEQGLLDSEATGPRLTARMFALKMAAPEEWREPAEPAASNITVTVEFVRPKKKG